MNFPFFVAILLVLFAGGIPVAFAIGVSCLVYLVFFTGVPPLIIVQTMQRSADSFTLMALPFFMIAANLMNEAGITERLVRLADAIVGHITGGLAHVNILANMIMAGMSGSASADASGIGAIMIPTMRKQGYSAGFSAALTAAASTIGPIIPPSIPFVIYGTVGGVSVGDLFLGGAIPGVLMGLFLMVSSYLIAKKRRYPKGPPPSFRRFWATLREALPGLGMPVVLVGGIVGGIFTPTEASVAAVIYSLIIGFFVYRTLKLKKVFKLFIETAEFAGVIMFIVATSEAMGWLLAREGVSEKLVTYFTSVSPDPWIFLLCINIFFLLLGCIESSIASLIIFTPILMPVVAKYGINPVHFGIMLVLNLMIGLITPPYGMSMFITCKIANISVTEFSKDLLPNLVALVIVLILITYIPGISLWLPNLFE
jgi:tripartite ATP-independent transporter DctM subunit